ncbi:MAG: aldehyde dehydrogenase family protein, partial [Actinomycetota bacterium]
ARSYEVTADDGAFLANVARASRKDVRDAVAAARKAVPGWASASAYNRGQVLYRVAEMMESRRAELAHDGAHGQSKRKAAREVDDAIDVLVWYAGLCDKLTQITGGLNQVTGPYFNLTLPEATGVVAIIPSEEPALFSLCARMAPALCGGNAVVTLASETMPLSAITLAECIATADVPGGVVNLLTGYRSELVAVLASHGDVDAIDLTGVDGDVATEAEIAAADNVKRVVRSASAPSPFEATAFMEMKTVWHPKGL